MSVLRTAYVNVLPKTDQFDSQLKSRLRRIDARAEGKRVGQTFGAGFTTHLQSLGGVARTAMTSVLGAITGAAGAGVLSFGLKTAASLEQAQIGFETLLGSAKSARSFLGDLKSFAAKTPFELPGLIDSSRTLLGVGVSAKQVIPLLTAFGNTAGAVGVGQEQFQRIMLATSQAIASGRFMTEDLNQIMENGIPIWTILSKAIGKPVPELRKMASAGKLLTSDVLPILQAQMQKDYGGAMARQSQTLAGVWSTLKDTVAIGLANVLQPLVPILAANLPKAAAAFGTGLQFAGTAVSRVVAAVRGFVPALQGMAGFLSRNREVIVPLVAALGAAVVTIKVITTVTRVWAAAQALLDAALAANPIGIVVVALAALVTGLIFAYKNSETFRKIVDGAFRGVAAAAKWAWETVIRPAVTAMVAFFRNVVAPAALWLWRNVIKPAWVGISTAVKIAWTVIQVALAAWMAYLRNVVFPVVRFLWNNVIKPVFSGIGNTIRTVWNGVVKPVLTVLGTFIRNTVAPAFTAGVNAIRNAWNRVKEAARTPVAFVVNRVINPLIGGFNTIAGKLGVKDRIPTIGGFARGGQIPGAPSHADNRLAAGPNGLLQVASGEFITNTASTLANLPLLQAINRKRGRVGAADIDPYLDGFARGGRVGKRGQGDGIGDFFGKIWNSLKGAVSTVSDALLHPKEALTRIANAAIARIPGGGMMRDVTVALGRKVIAGVGAFLQNKLGFGGIGGQGVFGGWRGMQRLIAARFPGLHMISGFRPGARTLSGSRSYHALGRAVDYPPVRALAQWIRGTFGAKTKELISPWNELNLLNGRPHRYTGAVWNQHNFAGGNAHVHWAAALGGLVGRKSGIPIFDTGGVLAPGFNTVYNATGRPERVAPAGRGDVHVHLHNAIITSKRQAVDLVVEAVTTAKRERRLP